MSDRSRREFLAGLGAGAASIAVLGMNGDVHAADSKSKPNLLIIHTDQLSSWALSVYARGLLKTPNYGRTVVHTPNIDRLGNEGARLTEFYTNSAVCTPSRGCLLTGRYPHCHGAYRNNIEMNRDEVTIAHVLKRNGYETGYAGKWHLDGQPKPGFLKPERSMGFDECRYMFNRGHWKKMEESPNGEPGVQPYKVIGNKNSYTTDYLTGKAIEFICRERNRPFLFMLSLPDPHPPFTVREPYMSMFNPDDMPVPNTFVADSRQRGARRTTDQLKIMKARYCGLVKCIDDSVGRIIRGLETRRLLDDTIVVFTTDHGEYMGEHGLWGKNRWYRTAYRIPFLVRWPRKIKANTVIDRFVTNVDVQQTLLRLMGLKPCGREQGRDASALLTRAQSKWENVAYIHHSTLGSAGIFTPEWEIVLTADGKHMLFDRRADFEQTKNLAHDPLHARTFRRLRDRVIEHHKELKSPAMEWLPKT